MKKIVLQEDEGANSLFLAYSRNVTEGHRFYYDVEEPDNILFEMLESIILLDDIVRLPPHLRFLRNVNVGEDSRLEKFNGEVLGMATIHAPACSEFGTGTSFHGSLYAERTILSRFDCPVAKDAHLEGMHTLREFGPRTVVGGTLWASGASIERFDCSTGTANFENAQRLREIAPNARFNQGPPIIGSTPLIEAIPLERQQFLESRKTVASESVLVATTPDVLYWASPATVPTPNPRIGDALRMLSLTVGRSFRAYRLYAHHH